MSGAAVGVPAVSPRTPTPFVTKQSLCRVCVIRQSRELAQSLYDLIRAPHRILLDGPGVKVNMNT